MKCAFCDGAGQLPGEWDDPTCPVCEGTGEVPDQAKEAPHGTYDPSTSN